MWDFTAAPSTPVTAMADYARVVGPGADLLARPDAVARFIDIEFGGGPILEGTRLGRPVWMVPGTTMDGEVTLDVDTATGVVLAVQDRAGRWTVGYRMVEFPERIDPSLFVWDGPSTPAPMPQILGPGSGTWSPGDLDLPAHPPATGGPRVLRVHVEDWLIGDGQIPPPRIGDDAAWQSRAVGHERGRSHSRALLQQTIRTVRVGRFRGRPVDPSVPRGCRTSRWDGRADVPLSGDRRRCVAPRVWWRLPSHGRIKNMGAPRKYPEELRERATRMAVEARRDPDRSRGAIARIADQLGINKEALRTWVRQAEIDSGDRPGTSRDDATPLRDPEREVKELRRANAILKSASAFFAAELDRPHR